MGDELCITTYVDRPLVFGVVYTNFHLDRERLLLELSYVRILSQSLGLKVLLLRFRGYLCEIESGYQNCLDLHTLYCATVSASNFQVLRPVTMETRCFHQKLEFRRYPPKDSVPLAMSTNLRKTVSKFSKP